MHILFSEEVEYKRVTKMEKGLLGYVDSNMVMAILVLLFDSMGRHKVSIVQRTEAKEMFSGTVIWFTQ